MVKINHFVTFFILVSILNLFLVGAICDIYNYGEVKDSQYCDLLTKTFVNQKVIGSDCMNNFECLSDLCLNDKCTDLASLENQTESLESQINVSGLESGFCTSSPGCLNVSSLSNAYNTSNVCPYGGYKCYQCNPYYHWINASSSCIQENCTSSPGCLNVSSSDHAYIINQFCANNFKCFTCSSGYSWNGTLCKQNSGNSNRGGSDLGIYILTAAQFSSGYTRELKETQRLRIFFGGGYHYIEIVDILTNQVKIAVYSDRQEQNFASGESKKFNLDGDNTYDLLVTLNSFTSTQAKIAVKSINEVITEPVNPPSPPINPTSDPEPSPPEESSSILIYVLIFIIFAIIIVSVVIFVVYKKYKPSGTTTSGSSNVQSRTKGEIWTNK